MELGIRPSTQVRRGLFRSILQIPSKGTGMCVLCFCAVLDVLMSARVHDKKVMSHAALGSDLRSQKS